MSSETNQLDHDYQTDIDRASSEAKGTNSWIYWTIVGASLLLCLIVFITLYDIICRYRDRMKSQQMLDGGPPATPTHSFVYTIGIRADVISPGFETNMSVIRVELLDKHNRYVTSIAVPCFLLKFKKDKSINKSQSLSKQSEISEKPTTSKQKSEREQSPLRVKSMSLLQEQWSGTVHGELVTFQLARRRPLMDISAARVSHDCYVKDSYLVLRYIAIYDHEAKVNFMCDLKAQQIRAPHPCPPSAFQVYPVDRADTDEDMKSFTDLTRNRYRMFCPSCIKIA